MKIPKLLHVMILTFGLAVLSLVDQILYTLCTTGSKVTSLDVVQNCLGLNFEKKIYPKR